MTIATMDAREVLLEELELLPEEGVLEVLDFVRFLNLQLTRLESEARFDRQWLAARRIAREQHITDADIAAEIQAVRRGE